MTNKLLPVALVAALIGGSVGAFVMHSKNNSAATQPTVQETARPDDAQFAQYQPTLASTDNGSYVPAQFETASEQTAYKTGFADGFKAAQGGATGTQSAALAPTQSRVVYRNSGRSSGRSVARNSTANRQVYYDYQTQPRKRSFWQKHRDKLTVAMGAGGGAAVGGLLGGKKGAAIGALAGGGGSALWTYKIRNRDRRY
ncbi:MAG TPA: hypothetical protein VJU86_08690 [Pyrinomonadaceae bacterium]|nr:hypothetical protein [Pyrinomonadaceae bacterium]